MLKFAGVLLGALVAALLGSTIGATVSVALDAPSGKSLQILTGITLLIASVSLVLSVPSLLLIGLPITWPFRRAICRQPFAFAALYGIVGAVLGLWIAVLVGAAENVTLIPSIAIGGATAMAWILVVRLNRGWLPQGDQPGRDERFPP